TFLRRFARNKASQVKKHERCDFFCGKTMSAQVSVLEKIPRQIDFGLERDEPSFHALCRTWEVNLNQPWPDEFGTKLHEWANSTNLPRLRTISLFSGAGGLDIGFHDAGFDIVESVEINASYAETLKVNSKPDGYFGS